MPTAKSCLPVILLIVAGCATQPDKNHGTANANAAGPDTQCHSEQPTGSLISKTVCTTKAQRDAQAAAAEDVRDTISKSVEGRPGQ